MRFPTQPCLATFCRMLTETIGDRRDHPDVFGRSADAASPGERRGGPDLLLDSPSNMLDVPSITFLSNHLQAHQNTMLVVSHDKASLNEVATDIEEVRIFYFSTCDFSEHP